MTWTRRDDEELVPQNWEERSSAGAQLNGCHPKAVAAARELLRRKGSVRRERSAIPGTGGAGILDGDANGPEGEKILHGVGCHNGGHCASATGTPSRPRDWDRPPAFSSQTVLRKIQSGTCTLSLADKTNKHGTLISRDTPPL